MADPPSGSGHWGKQVGIIDEELIKNLAICGAVILVVIFALVPNPRIAIWAAGMQGRCWENQWVPQNGSFINSWKILK
jgi:hypothetical protein